MYCGGLRNGRWKKGPAAGTPTDHSAPVVADEGSVGADRGPVGLQWAA